MKAEGSVTRRLQVLSSGGCRFRYLRAAFSVAMRRRLRHLEATGLFVWGIRVQPYFGSGLYHFRLQVRSGEGFGLGHIEAVRFGQLKAAGSVTWSLQVRSFEGCRFRRFKVESWNSRVNTALTLYIV